jgi:hypothetical protein
MSMRFSYLSATILVAFLLTGNLSCLLDLNGNSFESYTLSVKPNVILLDKDVVYQGIPRLPIEVTVVRKDQQGNFGYEYQVYGETNSAGVYLSSKTWDFTIESTEDEIWITVYEENGALIGSCHKKYDEYRNKTYYQPDCLLYY